MASTRTPFSLDPEPAARARLLEINVSPASRDGVAATVWRALAEADRSAGGRLPSAADNGWDDAESWGAK